MNQTPKTSQSTLIIISLVAVIAMLLAGFGTYIWTQSANISTTKSVVSSSVNSSLNQISSSITSIMGIKSSVSTTSSLTEMKKLKTLSCLSFEISANTDKYKVGFDKFNSEYGSKDSALLESSKKEIIATQSIKCEFEQDDDTTLVRLVEKDYELPCWFCGGSRIQSLNLALFNGANVDKVISTTNVKSTNNINGKVTKMSFENMENKPVNYNVITFEIKDTSYSIRTESKSEYPTDAENEALLKDALELFNTIKVK